VTGSRSDSRGRIASARRVCNGDPTKMCGGGWRNSIYLLFRSRLPVLGLLNDLTLRHGGGARVTGP